MRGTIGPSLLYNVPENVIYIVVEDTLHLWFILLVPTSSDKLRNILVIYR